MVDLEKSEKLPPEHRYFNISVIWILYFRWVLRLLYILRVPHEVVTFLSIGLGLLSAYCFYWGHLITAAVALHFKDVFDACDGALARLTGRGHLIGRYLDSLGDFVVLTLVLGAVALRAAETNSSLYYLWGAAAILSTFIQCSFFNFYQLAYLERFEIKTLTSKRDESGRDDLNLEQASALRRFALGILRLIYSAIYGWQDRFVAAVDNMLLKRCPEHRREEWYGDRSLMVAQSALCFGTHIFVVIVFAVACKPQLSLFFILTVMNLYLIILLWYRRIHFGRLERKTTAV